jgi:MFS family permease
LTELKAARYRDVVASGEFRALFAAHVLSVIGDQFARVALAVLVFDRTGSASLTALMYALTFLPSIVGGPLLSGLADRFPRRRVMVVTDLARAALIAAMAIPGMPLAGLCALLVLAQLLAEPFWAARAATLPLVFDDHARFVMASSLSNIMYDVAQLIGFAGGALLVAGVDPATALLINAASFVVSAGLLGLGVKTRPTPTGDGGVTTGWFGALGAGVQLVWTSRRLRTLLGLLCVVAFAVTVEGLAVPYAAELGVGTAVIGLLFAAPPAGSLVGGLVLARIPHAWQLRLMTPLAAATSAVLVACALHPNLWVTLVIWFASGAFSAYFNVANAEYVKATPDHQRGQAVGLANTAARVAQGAAVLAAGACADLASPAVVIAAFGGVGALAAWVLAASWRRASSAATLPT